MTENCKSIAFDLVCSKGVGKLKCLLTDLNQILRLSS